MGTGGRFRVRMVRPGERGAGRRGQPRDASRDCYVILDTHRSDAEVARYPLAGQDADAVYHTARDAAQQLDRDHAD
jgi:hypothetical protein